jgi:hypothetical protein
MNQYLLNGLLKSNKSRDFIEAHKKPKTNYIPETTNINAITADESTPNLLDKAKFIRMNGKIVPRQPWSKIATDIPQHRKFYRENSTSFGPRNIEEHEDLLKARNLTQFLSKAQRLVLNKQAMEGNNVTQADINLVQNTVASARQHYLKNSDDPEALKLFNDSNTALTSLRAQLANQNAPVVAPVVAPVADGDADGDAVVENAGDDADEAEPVVANADGDAEANAGEDAVEEGEEEADEEVLLEPYNDYTVRYNLKPGIVDGHINGVIGDLLVVNGGANLHNAPRFINNDNQNVKNVYQMVDMRVHNQQHSPEFKHGNFPLTHSRNISFIEVMNVSPFINVLHGNQIRLGDIHFQNDDTKQAFIQQYNLIQ